MMGDTMLSIWRLSKPVDYLPDTAIEAERRYALKELDR